jgi:TPR repeat protein
MGLLYETGCGTDQDWTKAIEWYTKAAIQNNAIANYNPGKAIQLCSSIPDKIDDTWINLGEIYHTADAQFQDFPKVIECYEQTEGINKSNSLRGLGLLYEHGDGVDKDYEKALEYYMLSQEKGNKGAYYNIALLYYYGKGVAQDYFASFEYFERVLEGNCEESSTHVLVDNGTESNSHSDQQKKRYSYVSERIIYGESHFYLGTMNEKGQGTSQDHEKALEHFKRSHSYGIDRAKKFIEI